METILPTIFYLNELWTNTKAKMSTKIGGEHNIKEKFDTDDNKNSKKRTMNGICSTIISLR